MAGGFGVLAGLASTRPGAAILLHAWPHETLRDQLFRCFGARVRQIVDGLEHLGPEGTWNVRSRSPSRRVAVDGDRGAGDR
jgi:hypothetical protein